LHEYKLYTNNFNKEENKMSNTLNVSSLGTILGSAYSDAIQKSTEAANLGITNETNLADIKSKLELAINDMAIQNQGKNYDTPTDPVDN
jgi:hypothetical protein